MDTIKTVKKAQKGNVSAFEKLILSHKLVMYRVAKTILLKDEDAADAIQEAILKAFQNIETLREPIYFKTWLLRIVMNECYKIANQKKKLISMEDWKEPYSNDAGYEKIEVKQLLEILPEEQSQLLKLYHIDDISVEDLALLFEVPENTIKTRLRRSREKLRELLEKQEEAAKWKNSNQR